MAHLTWLHLSDIHLPPGSSDTYRIDKVLKALMDTLAEEASRGFVPDLIFFTGDLADRGTDYAKAESFFDDLLKTTSLTASFGKEARRRLFIVPGNHDVDRNKTKFLPRPLSTRSDADDFFSPGSVAARQTYFARFHAYAEFFNRYFGNIRSFDVEQHYYAELLELDDLPRVGIIGLNSAWFAQSDDDEKKLWIGERVCDEAFALLASKGNADIIFTLHHHPYSWLHPEEAQYVKGLLTEKADISLFGHMHFLETEEIKNQSGKVLRFQSGAVYDKSPFPYRILWGRVDTDSSKVNIKPMTFQEGPPRRWTLDTSVYPDRSPDYSGDFALPRELHRDGRSGSTEKERGVIGKHETSQVGGHPKKNAAPLAGLKEADYIAFLLGNDPVSGDLAVAYFSNQSAASVRKLLSHLGESNSTLPYQVSHRMARIFGAHWQASASWLLEIIKKGSWFAKVDASKCFRHIPSTALGNEFAELLEVNDYDVNRCAIEALGYSGADNWAFRLPQIVFTSEYAMEKLAQTCVEALARSIVKETSDSDLYYDLGRFEDFLARWRREDKKLKLFSRFSVERIFEELTPVAADGIAQYWLSRTDVLIRQLGADALGNIRLARSSKPLAEILLNESEDYDVRCCAALALGQTGGAKGDEAILTALSTLDLSNSNLSYHGKTLRGCILAAASQRLFEVQFKDFPRKYIDEMVSGPLDIEMQTLYALGLLNIHTDHLTNGLHSETGQIRGAAALGLAHRHGKTVLKQLRFLEDEAANPFERVLLETALVIASNGESTDDLHRALCNLPYDYRAVNFIIYQWKREILYALSLGGADGMTRATAWAGLMGVNLRRCSDEMNLILSNTQQGR